MADLNDRRRKPRLEGEAAAEQERHQVVDLGVAQVEIGHLAPARRPGVGPSPLAEPEWRDALRSTAAHSTLVLADTNSAELREDGLGRRPEVVEAERQEAEGAQWLDATHDGWKKILGAVHRRRLWLSESGDDLRGADVVMMLRLQNERMKGALLPSKEEYHQRFGLTPEKLALAKPDAIVMHPGPMNRGLEITAEAADDPRSRIIEQVGNGVSVRMAALYLLLADEGNQL